MSESRRCSTSAGNELMKREEGGNSPRGDRKVGAANGIVTLTLPCMCVCACESRVLTCVCVDENCRDRVTVVRVRWLSREDFILGMSVLV